MAGATRLEVLAASVPIDPSELRALLRREIAKARARLAAQARVLPTVRLICAECGGGYDVAHTSAAVRNGDRPLCYTCRYPRLAQPTEREWRWVNALDAQVRDAALDGVAALSALV